VAKVPSVKWIDDFPVVPFLAVLSLAFLSQRHELSADAHSAQFTGDPEGMIAALGQLARLTRLPLDWGGVQGSILSHPSTQRRALALARRFNLPETSALAILEHPELAGGETYSTAKTPTAEVAPVVTPAAQVFRPTPETAPGDPIFSTPLKISHMIRSGWLAKAVMVGLLLLVAQGMGYLIFHTGYFQLLLKMKSSLGFKPHAVNSFKARFLGATYLLAPYAIGVAMAFWLYLRWDVWWGRRFLRKLERRIRARLGCADGMFVGLRPGSRVITQDGFYDWDLGCLYLESGTLKYVGERTMFSLPRGAITKIELVRGPISWAREFRVLVGWEGGCFTLGHPAWHKSRKKTEKLRIELCDWLHREHEAGPSASSVICALPALPSLEFATPARWRMAWSMLSSAAALFLACMFLVVLLPNELAPYSFVPFTAPLFYIVAAFPVLLRREVRH